MKNLIAIALFAGILAIANAQKEFEVCYKNVESACSDVKKYNEGGEKCYARNGAEKCDARYGAIDEIEPEVQNYINAQLHKSFEFMLLAQNFHSYLKDRPGLQKLYQSMSDRSFNDTIDLIKHLTRRGGVAKLEAPQIEKCNYDKFLVNELESLVLALDMEKHLAHGANHLYAQATHLGNSRRFQDPELAHYIEEKFLHKQSQSIRKLSGYANDLAKLMSVDNSSLSVYLFDEYLLKKEGGEEAISG